MYIWTEVSNSVRGISLHFDPLSEGYDKQMVNIKEMVRKSHKHVTLDEDLCFCYVMVCFICLVCLEPVYPEPVCHEPAIRVFITCFVTKVEQNMVQ